MNTNNTLNQLSEVATRIKELREIMGFSVNTMTERTNVTEKQYLAYESGKEDIPFSFIHKCALAFGVEMTDLLEGQSAKLSSYTVTRRGNGKVTANEDGKLIQNLEEGHVFEKEGVYLYYYLNDGHSPWFNPDIFTDISWRNGILMVFVRNHGILLDFDLAVVAQIRFDNLLIRKGL